MNEQTQKIIKTISKIAFVILITIIIIKALFHIIIGIIPILFWAFILLGIYGLFQLINEKQKPKE